MRYLISTLFIGLLVSLFAFRGKNTDKVASEIAVVTVDSIVQTVAPDITPDPGQESPVPAEALDFVEYAKTLTGTPYLYGSIDPARGLDCSGFINAVSNHFGIKVPRSSVEFTNVGTTVETGEARPGDLVLFTGTDPGKRVVGHMGIVTNNDDGHLKFIHSTSGKAKGVTTSDLDGYYQTRFVKVIRIFPTAADKVVS
ncbi:MAG TPA: C40 family peptidase [Chitinophagaceae bacterium]|nr:C40 family peptidase [Chitinophagaceae bacterium]